MSGFEIIVTGGPDVGARQVLSGKLLVGRGRDAELQLTDLSVSRRHLEVELVPGGARVTVVGSASSFAFGGKICTEALVPPGERIVIGETALTLVARPTRPSPAGHEVTKIQALLDDAAVEARGLAAVFALGEDLEAARDETDVAGVVRAWGERALGIDARIRDGGEQPSRDETLSRRLGPDRWELLIPLQGAPGSALAVTLIAERIGTELHRLLAVAGRMVSASLVQVRRLAHAHSTSLDLRRLAIGSATNFLGTTAAASRIAALVPRLARSDVTTLIQGETGVGKSFLARIIHELSPRRDEPFRVINCAAIPAELVESELFGHERGAFTGAHQTRVGAFEAAGAGTLLLDEVGDLPLHSQPKLLSVLESKQFERVGSNQPIPLRARVLVATHRDLEEMVREGTFRRDMYYRISALSVAVPAMGERVADIPLLAERFLADMGPGLGRRVQGISADAMAALQAYPWPGNARELRNVLEHAVVLGEGPTIELIDLPERVTRLAPPIIDAGAQDTVTLPMSLAALERRAIVVAMRACGDNRTQAATLLGINRVTLYKKLKALDLD